MSIIKIISTQNLSYKNRTPPTWPFHLSPPPQLPFTGSLPTEVGKPSPEIVSSGF